MFFTRRSKIILIVLIIISVGFLAQIAWAAEFNIVNGIVGSLSNEECIEKGNCDFCDWINLFVVLEKVILSLFGGLALVLMVWAGQSFITAAGNQEKIAQAKRLMTSTIFGVVIILAGYFLVNILIGILVTPSKQPLSKNIFGQPWVEALCPPKKPTKT